MRSTEIGGAHRGPEGHTAFQKGTRVVAVAAAAPGKRNSQTRGSKFHRIVWAHCLGSELQPGVRIAVPHLVQGLGVK